MKLSVLTWNIWFDKLGQKKRFQTILQISLSLSPDVMCFQEVLPNFITLAMEIPQLLEEYEFSDDGSGITVEPYGVLMLVKKKYLPTFLFHDMPSYMDRKLLTAKLGTNDVLIGTVHLESLNQHQLREAQLRVAKEALRRCENSILCGDFNFCSYRNFIPQGKLENESLREILPEYIDIWPSLRAEEKGFTFDSERNVMIHQFEQMRYDRIVAKLNGGLTASSIDLIGTEKLTHENVEKIQTEDMCNSFKEPEGLSLDLACFDECPAEFHCSDHFGLLAEFSGLELAAKRGKCSVS
eukprot:CAMPEP_0117877244 /NCGR_PEP_ID=MMETSP0950-20121206/14081_1 /TAXON_ID=44440 /ORGANISM="Chattonella subsalsa, Strain CCMP2191" /LENGTH=295 /DNA_ID=CAMNT_0005731207 /DNA_START=26 /DNA_END=913 /DNA_ORIENTATION=+